MSGGKGEEARRVGAILKWMRAHEEEMARAVETWRASLKS